MKNWSYILPSCPLKWVKWVKWVLNVAWLLFQGSRHEVVIEYTSKLALFSFLLNEAQRVLWHLMFLVKNKFKISIYQPSIIHAHLPIFHVQQTAHWQGLTQHDPGYGQWLLLTTHSHVITTRQIPWYWIPPNSCQSSSLARGDLSKLLWTVLEGSKRGVMTYGEFLANSHGNIAIVTSP